MKKVLCGLMVRVLLSGCSSGVSQEEYDRVVSKRDELQGQLDETELNHTVVLQESESQVVCDNATVSIGSVEWISERDDAFRVPLKIENEGSTDSQVMLGYKLYSPDGEILDNPHLEFGDSLSIAFVCSPNETASRFVYFPYVGDGVYSIGFGVPWDKASLSIGVQK